MCILELKANSVSFNVLRKEYNYIDIEIDSDRNSIEEVPETFYSKDWVLNRKKTQEYGDDWFKLGRSLILKVSSAVLPTDSNFILNTTHPHFIKLKFQKPLSIPLDPRVK
jgi:RES domain-containing protein